MKYKIVLILLLSVIQLQAQTVKKAKKVKKAVATETTKESAASEQDMPLVWHTDMNKAVALSNSSKKPMLLFFTGSVWCGWCMRLQSEVLKTPEFAAWAKKNVILVELDYARGGSAQLPEFQKQNAELQQGFQVQGFPTVWFVNAEVKDGKINFVPLDKTGYVAGGPAAWLAVADGILQKK